MRYSFFLVLVTGIFSCQTRQPGDMQATAFNIDSVKAHILEMNKSYGERFMTNDSAFYVSRYCKDAEIYSPGMAAIKGRDSIINFFYQNGANTEAKIELPPGDIYGNEELVVEEGTYNFPDGKGGTVDKGKFIAIWKKEEGNWKLYREIWNTDLAPQQ